MTDDSLGALVDGWTVEWEKHHEDYRLGVIPLADFKPLALFIAGKAWAAGAESLIGAEIGAPPMPSCQVCGMPAIRQWRDGVFCAVHDMFNG